MDEEFKKAFDDLAARVAALEEKMAPSKDEEAAPEDEKPEDEAKDKEMSAKLDLLVKELSDAKEKIKLLENTAKPVSQVTENKSAPKMKLVGRADF